MKEIIATGAEAIILRENSKLIKKRISKGYRLKEIDEKLRKLRTRIESKLLEKLQGKINVPKIVKVNEQEKEIVMQFISGKKLSEYLDNFPIEKQLKIAEEIGKEISKIHNLDIIHGDLTTSNMILVENSKNKSIKKIKTHNLTSKVIGNLTNDKENFQIFFIDFGLSFHSKRIEDKAVDLHLLRQALESKHFLHFHKLFKALLSDYNPQDKEKILKQLEKVEKRGRYKKNE